MNTSARDWHRLEARISGRVQGVGFRHFIVMRARGLGLQGWVRNEPDGAVYLVAEGPRRALEELLRAVEHGPPSARVLHVSADWQAATGAFSGFSVRH